MLGTLGTLKFCVFRTPPWRPVPDPGGWRGAVGLRKDVASHGVREAVRKGPWGVCSVISFHSEASLKKKQKAGIFFQTNCCREKKFEPQQKPGSLDKNPLNSENGGLTRVRVHEPDGVWAASELGSQRADGRVAGGQRTPCGRHADRGVGLIRGGGGRMFLSLSSLLSKSELIKKQKGSICLFLKSRPLAQEEPAVCTTESVGGGGWCRGLSDEPTLKSQKTPKARRELGILTSKHTRT